MFWYKKNYSIIIDLGDNVPMIFYAGFHCPGNHWFNLQCLNMEDDDIFQDEVYTVQMIAGSALYISNAAAM